MPGEAIIQVRVSIPIQVSEAQQLAHRFLRGLPSRWRHTSSVAARAAELSRTVEPADRPVLLAAAWLHDIGYAEAALDTGFHPLDGARLLDRHGWPARVGALVAHHSGALYVARVVGLAAELDSYPHERSAVADALSYADQTVGATGERLPIRQRIGDALRRHGPGSAQVRAHELRGPDLLAAGARVESRLASRD